MASDRVRVWDENGQEQDVEKAEKWDSWEKCKTDKRFPKGLIQFLEHSSGCNYPAPTAIQAHSWPTLTQGRDLIGIAKTGSGKTLAFLLPGFMWLKKNLKGDSPVDCQVGPAILVMTPTRELCNQIYEDAAKFGQPVSITASCVYGGANKKEQEAALRQGPHTLIATPGRLNDLVSNNIANMDMVRYCVLDEADRMLDMGFEPQIKDVLDKVPADGRQMAMFTATWSKECRTIAEKYINKPWHVQIGSDDVTANKDIVQHVKVVKDDKAKKEELDQVLTYLTETGTCLVFCNSKKKVKDLAWELGAQAAELHGDLQQWQRDESLSKFRNGEIRVLVATDLASRGLDIRKVSIVVNYDAPKSAEDYIHRIGRTGRAGDAGDAFTFLAEWGQEKEAAFIKGVMDKVGQDVPEEIATMAGNAQTDDWSKDDWGSKDDSSWNKGDDKAWGQNSGDDWWKNDEKKDDWNQKDDWNKDDKWGKKEDDWSKKDDWNKKDDDWSKKDDGWAKKDDDWSKKDDGWSKKDDDWKKTEDSAWNKEEQDKSADKTADPSAGAKAEAKEEAQVYSEEDMLNQLWDKLSDGCPRIGEQIIFDLVKQVHAGKGTAPDDKWYSEEQFEKMCAICTNGDPKEGLSKEQLLEVYRAEYDQLFSLKEHHTIFVLSDPEAQANSSAAAASSEAAMDVDATAKDAESSPSKRKAEGSPAPAPAAKIARPSVASKEAKDFAELEQTLREGKGDKLKVAQLREWLTFKGLPTGGLKGQLVQRAKEALQ